MYVFSICVLEFSVEEHEERVKSSGVLTNSEYDVLVSRYGSLVACIYTLWQSICGGLDWGQAAEPLMALSPILGVLFSLYIGGAVLCVLNVVNAVFVENVNQMSRSDDERVMMDQLEDRMLWVDEAKALFHEADTDNSGVLDKDKFIRHIEDVRVQAVLRKLGVEPCVMSGETLFNLLDFNQSGSVDADEFAFGLEQIHGSAKAIDIQRVRHDILVTKNKVAELAKAVQSAKFK